MKKVSDKIPGGLGDETKPSDVSPEELAAGVKVEMEHTDDPALAEEIALDHLTEDPLYYKHMKEKKMAQAELAEGNVHVHKFENGCYCTVEEDAPENHMSHSWVLHKENGEEIASGRASSQAEAVMECALEKQMKNAKRAVRWIKTGARLQKIAGGVVSVFAWEEYLKKYGSQYITQTPVPVFVKRVANRGVGWVHLGRDIWQNGRAFATPDPNNFGKWAYNNGISITFFNSIEEIVGVEEGHRIVGSFISWNERLGQHLPWVVQDFGGVHVRTAPMGDNKGVTVLERDDGTWSANVWDSANDESLAAQDGFKSIKDAEEWATDQLFDVMDAPAKAAQQMDQTGNDVDLEIRMREMPDISPEAVIRGALLDLSYRVHNYYAEFDESNDGNSWVIWVSASPEYQMEMEGNELVEQIRSRIQERARRPDLDFDIELHPELSQDRLVPVASQSIVDFAREARSKNDVGYMNLLFGHSRTAAALRCVKKEALGDSVFEKLDVEDVEWHGEADSSTGMQAELPGGLRASIQYMAGTQPAFNWIVSNADETEVLGEGKSDDIFQAKSEVVAEVPQMLIQLQKQREMEQEQMMAEQQMMQQPMVQAALEKSKEFTPKTKTDKDLIDVGLGEGKPMGPEGLGGPEGYGELFEAEELKEKIGKIVEIEPVGSSDDIHEWKIRGSKVSGDTWAYVSLRRVPQGFKVMQFVYI